jgi:undecaprenyl diphosphate synthase
VAAEFETLQRTKLTFAERHPALEEVLNRGQFPEGIAIIPDGNRRWAKERGLEPWEGHLEGLRNMIRITREYSDSPAKRILLWGSSVDNLSKRPEDELLHLNEYIAMGLEQSAQELIDDDARLIHVGNKDLLGDTLANLISNIEDTSAENTGQTIYLALAYGGADHDRRSKIKLAEYVAESLRINPTIDINAALTDDVLDSFSDASGGWKNMDLLIRTAPPKRSWDTTESGLQTFHLSGIGDVVGAKTIITTIPQYFPDLSVIDFDSAVLAFANSERRQGK